MKTLVYLISFLFISLGVFAQDEYRYNALSEGDWRLSGFGGYLIEFSSFSGELGVSTGGGGALLVNHSFYIGAYGMGLSNDIVSQAPNDQLFNLSYQHGGAWVGLIFRSGDVIHLSGSSKFGWGNLMVTDTNKILLDRDNIFVITPQIEGEVNVNRWFKINVGLGYRYTAGVTNNYIDKSNINSPMGTLSFLIGWFAKHDQRDETKDW